MKNIFKNKKFVLIASIITSILIVGLVGTYAWYIWSSNEEQRTRIVTSVGAATVVYEDGASMTGLSIKPVEDKNQGVIKNINVRTSSNATNRVSFNLYLDINKLDDGLKHESFRYELYKEDGVDPVSSGNFSQTYLDENLVVCEKNSTNHIVLLEDVTIDSKLSSYTLYIWIDGVNYTNPDIMMNQNFSFKLHADGQGAIIGEAVTPNIGDYSSGSFAYNIVNLYNNASEKTTVTNGSVKYYYDEVHNLMADIDGNVRYYGNNPNNYVYFNCDDYTNQSSSTCELWRIIGVVDGKVKIVREDSISNLAWDYDYEELYDSVSGKIYDNNWNDSTLMNLLNNEYYNNTDGKTYYNGINFSEVSETTTFNFDTSNIGIKNTDTRDLISKHIWNLGGVSSSSLYSDEAYSLERGNDRCATCNYDIRWEGNVALMNMSDYGYAADLSLCDQMLSNYNTTECKDNNWLYNKANQWMLTSRSLNAITGWAAHSNGSVASSGYYVYRPLGVRPTVYLDEDVLVGYGNGSNENPYQLTPLAIDQISFTDFTVTKENRSMIGYTGAEDEDWVIPAYFKSEDGIWYKVTSVEIYDSVSDLDQDGLRSITIPETVTSISSFYYAFNLENINVDPNNNYYSSLDGVLFDKNMTTLKTYPRAKSDKTYDIPDSVVTIEQDAFRYADFSVINIPNSVTSMGNFPFYLCHNLEGINVSDGNSSYTSVDGILFDNDITTLIWYPENKLGDTYIFPDGVITVSTYAFDANKNLLNVYLPDSLKTIESSAFLQANIVNVFISDKLLSIGAGAFMYSNLTDIYYAGTKEQWNAIDIGDSAWGYANLKNIHYNYVYN